MNSLTRLLLQLRTYAHIYYNYNNNNNSTSFQMRPTETLPKLATKLSALVTVFHITLIVVLHGEMVTQLLIRTVSST